MRVELRKSDAMGNLTVMGDLRLMPDGTILTRGSGKVYSELGEWVRDAEGNVLTIADGERFMVALTQRLTGPYVLAVLTES
jgi:hypothetical protein